MPVAVFTESRHPMDGLLEHDYQFSIDEVIIAANQSIAVGAPLGAIAVTGDLTLTGAIGSNNVGTSTIGSISGTSQSQNGVYNIVLISGGSTGEFEVQRPDGTVDGTGKIGTPYAGSIAFTISSAGTPTIGDSFTVTVTRPFDEAGEQFEPWSPTASDGSQVPTAIALYPAVTGSGQTTKIAALRREGAFRLSAVSWPVGATAAQQAFAQVQLAERKIALR
jgi:hypothetical protein